MGARDSGLGYNCGCFVKANVVRYVREEFGWIVLRAPRESVVWLYVVVDMLYEEGARFDPGVCA